MKRKMPEDLLKMIGNNAKFSKVVDALDKLWLSYEDSGLQDISPVENNWRPAFELGPPTSDQYTDEPHYGEPIEVIVENCTKALLALAVQHLLDVDLFVFVNDGQGDLISYFKDPAKAKNSDLAKWIIWMVREELILKAFGSLESFFGVLFRLREEGKGYLCRLYQCSGFSYKLAQYTLRNDQGGLKMLDFLYSFAAILDERECGESKFSGLLGILVMDFDWVEQWNPGTEEEFEDIKNFCQSKGLLADTEEK